jgi:hypothetical protein
MQRLLPFVLRNAGSLLALDGGTLALCAFFCLPSFWVAVAIGHGPVSSIHFSTCGAS